MLSWQVITETLELRRPIWFSMKLSDTFSTVYPSRVKHVVMETFICFSCCHQTCRHRTLRTYRRLLQALVFILARYHTCCRGNIMATFIFCIVPLPSLLS